MSESPKDLMGYLLSKFEEECQARGRDGEPVHKVDEFVEFCRETLRGNQPTSMDYIERGFAIRLQDGTVVPFVDEPVEGTGGIAGSIEVTKPDKKSDKGIDHKNSFGFDITGGVNEQR